MATRDGEVDVGEWWLGFFEEDGVDMSFEVIDAEEGYVSGGGECFGEAEADEEGTGEAGSVGDGDGVYIRYCNVGFFQRSVDDRDDEALVIPGCQLRNDSPVLFMNGLGRHDR